MNSSPTLTKGTRINRSAELFNDYRAFRSNPVNLLDPMGLQAATQPSVPRFKGFEDDRYQKHDALIDELVRDFNANKEKYCGCTANQVGKVGDITPAMVKSWMIQETGGNDQRSRDAWEVDPTQVNVPGDWNKEKEKIGLKEPTKRNEGDIRTNLTAALKYLCRKGFGGSGRPASERPEGFFDGWDKALERYGPPNRKDFYPTRIIDRANNPDQPYPIQDQ